jgi:hypothetical protein
MRQASKSKKRVSLLDMVSEAMTHNDIFHTINYRNKNEDSIKQFIYPHLVDALAERMVEEKGLSKDRAKEVVKKNLKWEGNVNTTVNHVLFMGTQNRPDMVLETDGLKIGIEFKKGESGSALRSGIGQSMIYSTHFDFVIYLFIDTTDDKRIANSVGSTNESEFIDLLWKDFNIKFVIK